MSTCPFHTQWWCPCLGSPFHNDRGMHVSRYLLSKIMVLIVKVLLHDNRHNLGIDFVEWVLCFAWMGEGMERPILNN